jgi:hypothetical protein
VSILFAASDVYGGEREYMDAVGRLLGLSRSPDVIRGYCARRVPNSKEKLQILYDDWFERNSAHFRRIDETLQRADKYMRERNSPTGPHSIAEVLASVTMRVELYLEKQTSEEAISFCGEYPKLLESKDAEFVTEIPRLIQSVETEEASLRRPM